MDDIPYQMISNLSPQTRNNWRLKVQVTRMWQQINRDAEIVGINLIFVDGLGGRIQAYIPRQIRHQFEDHIIEGETYDVNNFVVRRYSDMQFGRCFASDIYIQLNHMTEVLLTGDVDYIPPHVFQFTDLSTLMEAASENKFLIDVVGILEHHDPISTFRNRYNQQKSCFRFTINDMHTSAEVLFYDEMAEEFDQAIHDAVQHPIIVIISSCQAQFFRDAPKLSNLPPTRFFINPNHGAVEDLRDALRLAAWHNN
ncbi:uncharacterized protein LOC108221457 [Daucus carota subsp. sativus]|uniref:uncharacterized protein LOC108221457 n=1 Tax=Daucus carota subsp. sativus TaxID=79200 RepID=UPI003082C424